MRYLFTLSLLMLAIVLILTVLGVFEHQYQQPLYDQRSIQSDSLIMKNYSILIHPQREDGGGDYKVILRRYIVKSYDLKGASVQAETIVKPGETFSCQEQNPKTEY